MVLTDTPLTSAFSIKAYNHYLGESTLSFFASPAVASKLTADFPACLQDTPMLLPTKQYAVRQLFDRWCTDNGIFPIVRGQYDDSALMKSFGQAGFGVFFMPSIIEEEVKQSFGLEVVGRSNTLKQKFYAISAERKVTHPAVAAICDTARDKIFK
jgi:LysR family transcriptional activator of nhaA